MKISFGDTLRGWLWATSTIFLSIASATSVSADCPTGRFHNIDQEANFFMRDSPIIFVGKILKTRLISFAEQRRSDPLPA